MTVPTVEVLLSTYNGATHLATQIDSILAQDGVAVRLVVRDDGSTDETIHVLSGYADDPRVEVSAAKNLGLPTAYFRLIQDSGDDADVWALADQDDVWLPNKLRRAATALAGTLEPTMYCARVLVVDEALRPLYPHPLPKRGPSFANALVQNIATGCTIAFNRAARDVLRDRWPDDAVMHDAWLYLVISGTGTVLYDEESVVRYRQHAGNSVGMGRGRAGRTLRRIRRQLAPGEYGAHGRQDAELLRTHGDVLTASALSQLEASLAAWRGGMKGRLRYAVRGPAHRQTVASDIVMRLLALAGRI